MGDTKPENIDALVDEILALRVENQRACDRSLALTSRAGTKRLNRGSLRCSPSRTGRTSKATSMRTRQLRPRSPCSGSCSPAVRMCTPFAGRAREPERPAVLTRRYSYCTRVRTARQRWCLLKKSRMRLVASMLWVSYPTYAGRSFPRVPSVGAPGQAWPPPITV